MKTIAMTAWHHLMCQLKKPLGNGFFQTGFFQPLRIGTHSVLKWDLPIFVCSISLARSPQNQPPLRDHPGPSKPPPPTSDRCTPHQVRTEPENIHLIRCAQTRPVHDHQVQKKPFTSTLAAQNGKLGIKSDQKVQCTPGSP